MLGCVCSTAVASRIRTHGEVLFVCAAAPYWGVTGMHSQPFQDRVDWHCYGCGRLNDHGLQIKSHWDGDDVVCRWQAKPFHVGLPGRLQGGVIATAIICHALWTATATACRNEGIEIEEPMGFAYSTTSLQARVPGTGACEWAHDLARTCHRDRRGHRDCLVFGVRRRPRNDPCPQRTSPHLSAVVTLQHRRSKTPTLEGLRQ